jgi:hypothetical protein
LLTAKSRERKRCSGTIGTGTRDSTSTKPRRAATPPSSGSRVRGPASPPTADGSRRAKTIAPSPSTAIVAPRQSSAPTAPSSRVSRTPLADRTNTAAASGTFRRKIHRHDARITIQPPTRGPIEAVTELAEDHRPMAAPRSSSPGLAAAISARLPGTSIAAPTPWTPRATTSALAERARPHAMDAIAKRPVPTRKTRFLPYRSPSAPPTSTSAARNRA